MGSGFSGDFTAVQVMHVICMQYFAIIFQSSHSYMHSYMLSRGHLHSPSCYVSCDRVMPSLLLYISTGTGQDTFVYTDEDLLIMGLSAQACGCMCLLYIQDLAILPEWSLKDPCMSTFWAETLAPLPSFEGSLVHFAHPWLHDALVTRDIHLSPCLQILLTPQCYVQLSYTMYMSTATSVP